MFGKNKRRWGRMTEPPPGSATDPGSAAASASSAPDLPKTPVKSPRPLWRRRLILTLVVLFALGGIFHAPLLRAIGQIVQVSDPLPEGDYALVLWEFPGCARNFDTLVQWAGGEHEVIIARPKLSRLMKIGLEKPWGQVDIEQLQLRGLQKVQIWNDPEARYLYQLVPQFEKWLAENPAKSLVIVHGRMFGRFNSLVFSRHLSKENRARIFFSPIDSPEFDGANWYRTKEGQTAFFDGATRVLFDLILGDGEMAGPDWDPQAYEDSLP